jgi:O-antigen/teichoic acid export membrane protein|tara:strand:+ start:594 stop:875 length:282 start_codon:yes stop_codon:yes gene_type:complete
MMKNIRNLNDKSRTTVYTVGYAFAFVIFVTLIVFAIEMIARYVGEDAAWMLVFGSVAVYFVISMSVFNARNRVRDENELERQVLRRLQAQDDN